MNQNAYYMNVHTGSVATYEDWLNGCDPKYSGLDPKTEVERCIESGELLEVIKVDGEWVDTYRYEMDNL